MIDDNTESDHNAKPEKRKSRKKFTIAGLACVFVISYFAITKLSYKTAIEIPYSCTKYCWLESSSDVSALKGIEVSYNNREIIVKNTSSDNWDSCSPIALGDYFFDGSPGVLANSDLVMPYRDFTGKGDLRLDPDVIKPTEFTIQCDKNGFHYANKFTLE